MGRSHRRPKELVEDCGLVEAFSVEVQTGDSEVARSYAQLAVCGVLIPLKEVPVLPTEREVAGAVPELLRPLPWRLPVSAGMGQAGHEGSPPRCDGQLGASGGRSSLPVQQYELLPWLG